MSKANSVDGGTPSGSRQRSTSRTPSNTSASRGTSSNKKATPSSLLKSRKKRYVKEIIGKRIVNGEEEYLVCWRNLPKSCNSWESPTNLPRCKMLLKKYNEGKDGGGEVRATQKTYTVKRLLDKRIVDGNAEYLVHWASFPVSASTWEPIENLSGCPLVIEEYEKWRRVKEEGNEESMDVDEENASDKRSSASPATKECTEEEIRERELAMVIPSMRDGCPLEYHVSHLRPVLAEKVKAYAESLITCSDKELENQFKTELVMIMDNSNHYSVFLGRQGGKCDILLVRGSYQFEALREIARKDEEMATRIFDDFVRINYVVLAEDESSEIGSIDEGVTMRYRDAAGARLVRLYLKRMISAFLTKNMLFVEKMLLYRNLACELASKEEFGDEKRRWQMREELANIYQQLDLFGNETHNGHPLPIALIASLAMLPNDVFDMLVEMIPQTKMPDIIPPDLFEAIGSLWWSNEQQIREYLGGAAKGAELATETFNRIVEEWKRKEEEERTEEHVDTVEQLLKVLSDCNKVTSLHDDLVDIELGQIITVFDARGRSLLDIGQNQIASLRRLFLGARADGYVPLLVTRHVHEIAEALDLPPTLPGRVVEMKDPASSEMSLPAPSVWCPTALSLNEVSPPPQDIFEALDTFGFLRSKFRKCVSIG